MLEQASATLHPGEKVGLIGRNGAGKSSLFSLLAGRLAPDAGDVEIPPSWLQPGGMAEVAQNMPETDEPATEFVLQGDGRLMKARQDLIDAEAAEDGHAMAEAHMALAEAGQFDAQARAQALLLGLGFKLEQTQAPVNSFSGGWRMRLQLARALMCPAKLLLLDEPTNHLDLDALVWLESWLQRYEGTLVVISHDREFLDAITKVTLHLEDGKLTRYTGGYSAFEAMRAERLSQQQAAFAKQQDKIAHLSKFIARFKAKASKAKQAQSRVKALERMEKIAPVLTASDFQFSFPEPDCLPNPMMALKDLACGYHLANDETLTIVSGINRSVLPGQRIGILGANGQGKSTVVKTLAHMNRPISGEITEGKGLSIGYFAQQELDVLRPDEGPLQHMIRLARDVGPQAREQELRDFLGRFQFTGDMVNQAVGQFSGGEKARLVLALVVWQRPNLLLLDEPTNHLDLTTRDGDLDDYQRWLQDQAREVAQAAKAARDTQNAVNRPAASLSTEPTPPAANQREDRKALAAARQRLAEQTKPLKAELKKVDERLAQAHGEQAQLGESLAQADLSAADRAEQGKRLKALGDEIDALEARWLELTDQLEQLGA